MATDTTSLEPVIDTGEPCKLIRMTPSHLDPPGGTRRQSANVEPHAATCMPASTELPVAFG